MGCPALVGKKGLEKSACWRVAQARGQDVPRGTGGPPSCPFPGCPWRREPAPNAAADSPPPGQESCGEATLPTAPFPYQTVGAPVARGWTPRPGKTRPSSGALGCSGTDWDLHTRRTISLGLDSDHTFAACPSSRGQKMLSSLLFHLLFRNGRQWEPHRPAKTTPLVLQ